MTLPAYLLDADRYPHGTRARYVQGCRCDACRDANRVYTNERAQRMKEHAASIVGATPAPVARAWANGVVRTFKRSCIGVNGQPCPHRSYLRKDSTGDICRRCRSVLAFNGLVPSDAARTHLIALQRQGVGRRAVAEACDVSETTLVAIYEGRRQFVRAQANAKILAVDAGAIADHGLVPAAETQRLLGELVREGYTKTRIATQLGSQAREPALHFTRDFVLAKTALRVRRLHAQLLAEGEDVPEPDDGPRARILEALRWFEHVTAEELFDAMEVAEENRNTYTAALCRLAKVGDVERVGAKKPFEYRLARKAA